MWELVRTKEIIALYKKYPHQSQLQRRLGVSTYQLNNKLKQFGDDSLYNNPADLCQIPDIPQDKKSTREPNAKPGTIIAVTKN
ncbi:MAG: hypothetical protein COB50_03280 [Thiotrichales bacterium]|nr:MAG: hypothetical protein COB50_03280 [Thiotrichales bacterium]